MSINRASDERQKRETPYNERERQRRTQTDKQGNGRNEFARVRGTLNGNEQQVCTHRGYVAVKLCQNKGVGNVRRNATANERATTGGGEGR